MCAANLASRGFQIVPISAAAPQNTKNNQNVW
jgi:hypothetical protein